MAIAPKKRRYTKKVTEPVQISNIQRIQEIEAVLARSTERLTGLEGDITKQRHVDDTLAMRINVVWQYLVGDLKNVPIPGKEENGAMSVEERLRALKTLTWPDDEACLKSEPVWDADWCVSEIDMSDNSVDIFEGSLTQALDAFLTIIKAGPEKQVLKNHRLWRLIGPGCIYDHY